jgi:hypothetical protein
MTELFGGRWLNTYGDKPTPLWEQACDQLGAEGLQRGVDALLASGSAHPPSLPQFLALCSAKEAQSGEADALAYRMIPSFERKTCTRQQLEAIARSNLARARALLAGAEPSPREKLVMERFRAEMASGEIVAGWLERLS